MTETGAYLTTHQKTKTLRKRLLVLRHSDEVSLCLNMEDMEDKEDEEDGEGEEDEEGKEDKAEEVQMKCRLRKSPKTEELLKNSCHTLCLCSSQASCSDRC